MLLLAARSMAGGRPASAPPRGGGGLATSKSVQFEGDAPAARPSSAASRQGSVGRSASSSQLVGASQTRVRITSQNTQIRTSGMQRPGIPVDWSRHWINGPRRVYRRPPAPRPRPRPATGLRRPGPGKEPEVRVVRFMQIQAGKPGQASPEPEPEPGQADDAASESEPDQAAPAPAPRGFGRLRQSALAAATASVTHNQECILVLHGRLVGHEVQRPAMQYAPLLAQLMGRSPPDRAATSLLLEYHDFWPSISSEPKSLQLGPLGRAVTEALASQMRKYKKVTIIAHSLGAWLLYKALAELGKPSKKVLLRKLSRVVLISPVANTPWLGSAVEPRALTKVPCMVFVGNNDKLVQSWYVEAATRPWFPGVQKLQIIDGGTHLGCLLPSAADVWDRKIGPEQRRAYQADIAARIAEGMGWNPKSDTENDKGDLLRQPLAELARRLEGQLGCSPALIDNALEGWGGYGPGAGRCFAVQVSLLLSRGCVFEPGLTG